MTYATTATALSPLVIQGGIFAVTLATIALTPPANGRMLLIPLQAANQATLVMAATDAGATVIGRGPLAGSLIVDGTRRALIARARTDGLIVTAAPRGGCEGAR